MAVTTVTDATFKAEVSDADMPVLVDFWAEWCGPCKMLAPVVETISNLYDGKLKVCKLDVDQNPSTAQTLNIASIPCCIIFKNGEEIGRITGFMPQGPFAAQIDKILTS